MTVPERREKVFDLLLRGLHWWIALSCLTLMASSQLAALVRFSAAEARFWEIHLGAGAALCAGLLARLAWGVAGPWSARWRDLWHPRIWAGLLHARLPATARRGHDGVASLAYLLAYLLMLVMTVSGLVLAGAEFDRGPLAEYPALLFALEPWIELPHQLGFWLLAGFVCLHLSALIFHRLRGERVAQSMVTGFQYPSSGKEMHDG